jgi:PAS domain S-box-containing protein
MIIRSSSSSLPGAVEGAVEPRFLDSRNVRGLFDGLQSRQHVAGERTGSILVKSTLAQETRFVDAVQLFRERALSTRVVEGIEESTRQPCMPVLQNREWQLGKLALVAEQIPAIIMITDADGTIELVNREFCEVTGYSPDEVIGKNPRILKSGENPVTEYQDLWDAVQSGKEWQGRLCNRKKNGELFWEMECISPITDERGAITHVVALKKVITHRIECGPGTIESGEGGTQPPEADCAPLARTAREIRALLLETVSAAGVLHDVPNACEKREYFQVRMRAGSTLLRLTRIDGNSSPTEARLN